MKLPVNLADIMKAKSRTAGIVRKTPIDFSTTFSGLTGQKIYFKYENLQKTGSFKIRGAVNKMASLEKGQRNNGVIAASAGNHAQGVALAAAIAGIESTIV
ncbi:MAG TPA: pyridoxal-phosphate dependent enzyme, partial [Desulfobacteria bacterium]|nr:pyridoxal-phosphate dependent enzyme [Desulfobacteria bacterium]